MLDIEVLTRGMQLAASAGSQADAEAACDVETTPFDGVELAAHATGLPADTTRGVLLTGATPLPLTIALHRRGSLVVNTAGRIGLVVAPDRVLQPAGRQYALTDADTSWVAGWWPAGVTLTTATPVPLPTSQHYRKPGQVVATSGAADLDVTVEPDTDGIRRAAGAAVLPVTATRTGDGETDNASVKSGGSALPVTAARTATGGTVTGTSTTITATRVASGSANKTSTSAATGVTVTFAANAAGTTSSPVTTTTVTGTATGSGSAALRGGSVTVPVTVTTATVGTAGRSLTTTVTAVTANRTASAGGAVTSGSVTTDLTAGTGAGGVGNQRHTSTALGVTVTPTAGGVLARSSGSTAVPVTVGRAVEGMLARSSASTAVTVTATRAAGGTAMRASASTTTAVTVTVTGAGIAATTADDDYANNCEGAVAPGTNWTTNNQGAASGDPLTVTSTGGTMWTTTTVGEVIHDTKSLSLDPGGAGITQRVSWALTNGVSANARGYFRLPTMPTADASLVTLQGSGGACAMAKVSSTTGRIRMENAAGTTPTGGSPSTALTFGQVYGIDLICTPGTTTANGTARMVIYNEDGSVFADTGDIISNYLRGGTVLEVRFGVTVDYPVILDSMVGRNVYELAGPVTTSAPVDRNTTAGAPTVGSTSYAIPAGAKYASTSGSDTTGTGTSANPYATIQKACDNTAAGGCVVVRGGVYHEGGSPGTAELGITLSSGKENVTIQNYPGEAVWLDGSSVYPTWTTDTTLGRTIWRSAYNVDLDRSVQFSKGSVDGTDVGYVWLPTSGPGAIANWFDQGWIVNSSTGVEITRLTQVATKAEVTAGKFWVEGTGAAGAVFNASAVFIGTNPSGVTVRFGDKIDAFGLVADGAGIQGIGVRRYVGCNGDAAIKLRRNGNWLRDVYLDDVGGVGVDLYLGTRVGPFTLDHVTARRCGLNGMHAQQADNVTVNDCLFELNNISGWNMAPAAGGVKVTMSMHWTVLRSRFLDNAADGCWFDASCFDVNVGSCDAQDNAGHGLEFEISAKGIYADNLVTGSGKDGILIRCSDAARLWCNTSTGNAEVNIDVTQDSRRPANAFGEDSRHPSPTDPVYETIGMDWIVQAVDIYNNVNVNPSPSASGGALRIRSQESPTKSFTTLGPNVNGNVYGRANATSPSIGWALASTTSGAVGYTTFAAYKAATVSAGRSLDANGYSADGADPLDPGFVLKAVVQAAAIGGAVTLPADVAELIGKPTTPHLGAWL